MPTPIAAGYVDNGCRGEVVAENCSVFCASGYADNVTVSCTTNGRFVCVRAVTGTGDYYLFPDFGITSRNIIEAQGKGTGDGFSGCLRKLVLHTEPS